MRIVLVEALGRVLPNLDTDIAAIAQRSLERRGVEVRLNTRIVEVMAHGVLAQASGGQVQEIAGDTLLWTAGVRASPVVQSLGAPLGRGGALTVDGHLAVPDYPGVFALGDAAAYTDPATQKVLPADAKVAVQQGKAVAENVAHYLRGRPLRPFRYLPLGEMVPLGRFDAVAQVLGIKVHGLPAWLMWRVYYLSRLTGPKNRLRVLGDWAQVLLWGADSVRLEVEPALEPAPAAARSGDSQRRAS